MFKFGTANPLNVHNLRRLDYCPPHFVKLELDYYQYNDKDLSNWIYENLVGRFYLGYADVPVAHSMSRRHIVGFEIPSEVSYMGLSLPSISTS